MLWKYVLIQKYDIIIYTRYKNSGLICNESAIKTIYNFFKKNYFDLV